jgi:hypothetical protein
MLIGDLDKFRDIRFLGRDRVMDIGEEMRGRLTRCHGDHLPTALAETEPMHCSSRKVHQRARIGDHISMVGAIADRLLPLRHPVA